MMLSKVYTDNKQQSVTQALSKYDINYEVLYEDADLGECFQSYLKSVRNICPFLFLKEIECFLTYVGSKSRYICANKIISQYLCDKSGHEVNIGHQEKAALLENFGRCSEELCPGDLFDEVRISVYLELKLDCFDNFISSEFFVHHVEQKLKYDINYLFKIGTLKKSDSSSSGDSDLDSSNSTDSPVVKSVQSKLCNSKCINIEDDDFEQFEDMNDLTKWKLVNGKGDKAVYLSIKNHQNGKRRIKKCLETGIFNYSQQEVFESVCSDEFLNLQKKSLKNTYVDYMTFGKYAASVLHIRVKLKFPIADRDFVIFSSAKRLDNGDILILRKSINYEKVPPQKDYIRGQLFAGTLIQKIDENTTRYKLLTFTDLKGWMSPILFNKLLQLKKDDKYADIEKAIKIRRSAKAPSKNAPIMKTLAHFEDFSTP
ncbi:STARD6 [Acrasis kona]|uniref:STARD6 n=1 Tax=Acrasis kona TaxID=1008807 RepID=A0AAW2YUF3_9EUKA